MKIILLTGTDTDVGKTVVTATLAAAAQHYGKDVTIIKPCQTGLAPGESGDADHAAHLAGLASDRAIELVRLPEALAPQTAAIRAGITVPTVSDLAAEIVQRGSEVTIVEGAGGILVGLDNQGRTLLELADALHRLGAQLAFVVTVRSGLGTLNHTALTCQAIKSRGHECAGIVIGAWPENPDLAEQCNIDQLPIAADAPLLAAVAANIGTDPRRVQECARTIPASIFEQNPFAKEK